VVIITGDARGQTFCPGADSQALQRHVESGGYDPGTPADIAQPGYGLAPEFDADFAYLYGMQTVSIAAMNGAAAGVGLALAMWCDLRVLARGAKLTTAHGKLNLPAEYGLSWLLPRIIGHGRAADLLLTSRVVLADEALQLGLVNRVVDPDDVLNTAKSLAVDLVQSVSPHSLRATKQQLAIDATHDDPGRSIRDAQDRLEQMMTETDYHEATAAFIDRRQPRWQQ